VSLLRDYIVQQGLTLEKAFALFDVDRDYISDGVEVGTASVGVQLHKGSRLGPSDAGNGHQQGRESSIRGICEKMKRFYDGKAAPKRDFRQMTFQFPHLKEVLSADQLSN